MSKIKLADNFSIEAIDYAIQGNGILGLKEAGKTVTAKKCAEGLLNAGFPIVVFDPSGVWKYLRVKKQEKGYPVVAVGSTDCDIPLTEDSIGDVLLAARERNISLVVDLFGNRNKSAWRRIVGTITDTLMDNNAKYGLCHLFIEEAREFAPQRVARDLGVIYGKIETLCAVGGNSSVGYTLINQRAEDVNKSILELCERMILHNQSGKNSLKGMEEWFTRSRIDEKLLETIMQSLPRLESGECWILSHTKHEPTRIKVSELESIHPDRRKPETQVKIQKLGTDVSGFVSEIKKIVESKVVAVKPSKKTQKEEVIIPAQKVESTEVERLRNQLNTTQQDLIKERNRSASLEAVITNLKTALQPQYQALQSVFTDINSIAQENGSFDKDKWNIWLSKFNGKNRTMLEILIERKRVTRQQLGLLVGMSSTSGSFNTYVSNLSSVNLIRKEGNEYVINEI